MEFLRDFHLSKDNLRNDLEITTLRVLISLPLVYSLKVLVTLNYFQLYTTLYLEDIIRFLLLPHLTWRNWLCTCVRINESKPHDGTNLHAHFS